MKTLSFKSFIQILSLVLFVSCNQKPTSSNNSDEVEVAKLQLENERIRLEKERAEFETQKRADEERKQRELVAQKAAHAARFQPYYEAVVVSPKCFFHNRPDPTTIRKSFLVEGDRVMISKVKQEYIYVDFFNSYNGKSTSGWLNTEDLEPLGGEPMVRYPEFEAR
jgi:hypothetical protein